MEQELLLKGCLKIIASVWSRFLHSCVVPGGFVLVYYIPDQQSWKGNMLMLISRVSCQKGPTRHAYAWQIGPFWQDTLDILIKLSIHPSICLWTQSRYNFHACSSSWIEFKPGMNVLLDKILAEFVHRRHRLLTHWPLGDRNVILKM